MNKLQTSMAGRTLSILCAVAFLLSVQAQAMTCSEQVLAAKSEPSAGTPVKIEKLQQEKIDTDKKKGAGYGGIVMGIALIGLGMFTSGVGVIILVSVGAGTSVGSLYFAKAKELNGTKLNAQILTELSTANLYQESKDFLAAHKKDPKTEMGEELLAFKAGVTNKDVLSFGVADAIVQLVDKGYVCEGDKIAAPREILNSLNSDKTSLRPAGSEDGSDSSLSTDTAILKGGSGS